MIEGTSNALTAPVNGTLAEADQWEADALASIQAVDTAEQAETLLMAVKTAERAFAIHKLGEEREQRWKVLTLKAERRYGQLLDEAKPGPPKGSRNAARNNVTRSDVISSDERMARNRARDLAKVPAAKFDKYVEQEPKPSRSGVLGLLKKKPKKKLKPQLEDWLMDMLPGAEPLGAFRQAVVAWCDHERKLRDAMAGTGIELVPKSDDDREALLGALADVHKLAARLERQLAK